MIKADNLSKHFGAVKAVDNVSFEVAEGETMVLLGTSGCGKTTTLKMLNRLIEPSGGSISINGKDVASQAPEELRRGIGYVLQNNGLFPHYTVAENIAIVPNLLKWDKAKTQKHTTELLEKLHLSPQYLSAYPNELSGGQQQRVGLARALVADAPVLLMDEPFGALDNVTRTRIHAEFKALDELKRKTIIMVTHDVQEAFTLGDRVVIMDKGRIIQQGTPQQLLFKPANSFVSDFLKEQRLQLELRTIKLTDLWESLTDTGRKTHTDLLSAEEDMWTALEGFKFTQHDNINIINQDSREIKSVSFEDLMGAYNQYKKQHRHE
ncbi:ABC transporter ATP-binding protein [Mucilaginibacter sp. JRF]|uniref:ABC transporter ATP-binding protein n=1 Tax=Mucilaginibacter sp. JRF TaxID=2780088 RepID=UPI00187DDE43|nr:ABC transporter ATP-binding protein [Mucilaginibacter sp. JRF]MBE9586470.1 ABC transporter ATP-binding protein [Mucilaginibacter sp. JRF]